MADLSSRNGCGCSGGLFGGSSCCTWIRILILLSECCGNGNGLFGGDGCGCGDNSCIWIILLLLFCGNGFGGCGSSCC